MEQLLAEVEWVPTIVGFVVAFALGWAWYSPLLFAKGWMEGIGERVWEPPMWMPMLAQAGATFLFALLANIILGVGGIWLFVLITVIITGFIKANGLFAGKNNYAVVVESGYIAAMAVVLYLVNLWL